MSLLLAIVIFLPTAGALAVLLAKGPAAVRWISLAASILTLLASLAVAAGYCSEYQTGTGADGPIQPRYVTQATWFSFELPSGAVGRFDFYLGIDGISLLLIVLTTLLVFSSVLVSWESIQEKVAGYYALLLLLETGLLGVFCAFDLILFYIFFEFTLIPLFFLIGLWGGPQRDYAARKFFIYTLSGSVLGLVGLVGVSLALNSREPQKLSFSIPELASGMQRQMRLAEGLEPPAPGKALSYGQRRELKEFFRETQWWLFLALFAAFAIKVPLFPMHTWLPLAHVEAPTAGSVLLAGVLLKLGSYGFLRLCLPLLPYAVWSIGAPLIALLSVIGILYGALCALAQDDIKRLVAYSSVSHLGFCMLGLAALNSEGVHGSVLQMVNHGLSTGALFLLVGMVYERYHTRMLGELGGIAGRLPLLGLFMVFMCLSSAGLPGLNGFVGEVLSLFGMFKVWPLYAVLATAGIVLGAWYLLLMLRRAFFGPEKAHGDDSGLVDLKPRELWSLAPIAACCLAIGLYPRPFLDVIRPDVNAIVEVYEDGGRWELGGRPAPILAEAR